MSKLLFDLHEDLDAVKDGHVDIEKKKRNWLYGPFEVRILARRQLGLDAFQELVEVVNGFKSILEQHQVAREIHVFKVHAHRLTIDKLVVSIHHRGGSI